MELSIWIKEYIKIAATIWVKEKKIPRFSFRFQTSNKELFSTARWTARVRRTLQSWPCTGVSSRNASASFPQSKRSPAVGIKAGVGRFLLRERAASRQSIPPHLPRLCWAPFCLLAPNWRVPSGKRRQGPECWRESWCCRRRFSAAVRNKMPDPAWTRKLRARNDWNGKKWNADWMESYLCGWEKSRTGRRNKQMK